MSAVTTQTLDTLVNRGFHVVRACPDQPAKTIIVLGVARGGTSMIAAVLDKLGVFMGDAIAPVFEDRALSVAVEKRDKARVDRIISERNGRFSVWGWKRPSSINHISKLEARFRNPVYVAVFRDVFSIANRNRLSVSASVVDNMRQSLNQYAKLIDFIDESAAPCMLVSYDKALAHRQAFVENLARFVGMEDPPSVHAAIECVRADSPKYLDATRNTKSLGRLHEIREDRVSGWARRHRRNAPPVEVQLLINGAEAMSTKADEQRRNVKAGGANVMTKCGFSFRFAGSSRLRDGDEIRVRVIGDVRDLNNSPCVFRPDITALQRSAPLSLQTSPEPRDSEKPSKWQNLQDRAALMIDGALIRLGRLRPYKRRPATETRSTSRKIYYMHVAKTAGSSVNNFIASHYPINKVCLHFEGHPEWRNVHSEAPLADMEFLSGHVRLQRFARRLPAKDYLKVTTFRAPIDHLISHISWVRNLSEKESLWMLRNVPPRVQELSGMLARVDLSDPKELETIVRHLNPAGLGLFDNCQTRYLLNLPVGARVEKKHTGAALRRLREFDLVAITERLDESLMVLCHLMRWPPPERVMSLNVSSNKYGLDKSNPAIRDALAPLVAADRIIYQEAHRTFEDRLRGIFMDLGLTASDFRSYASDKNKLRALLNSESAAKRRDYGTDRYCA